MEHIEKAQEFLPIRLAGGGCTKEAWVWEERETLA